MATEYDHSVMEQGARLPLILDPEELETHLGERDLLVVDLSRPETYSQLHVPGAVHLSYTELVTKQGPARGMLPSDEHLSRLFSALGLTPDTHVVAYDDEGGGKAGRLLWTLDLVGHRRFSLLNGGLHAWANEGHPLSREPAQREPAQYRAVADRTRVADAEYIMARLQSPAIAILDARSPNEFLGLTQSALRNGHIPGAVNLEWTSAMDTDRNLRLKPAAELERMLEAREVTRDKEVIVHCLTHHRSAHTYLVLKALGYPQVKAY